MLEKALQILSDLSVLRPRTAVVLGSGFDALAGRISSSAKIPYGSIPGWPECTAPGHNGSLVIGAVAGVPVAVLQGRAHLYEGYSAREVTFPVRLLHRFGIRTLLLTNASGAIRDDLLAGQLVLMSDHINLQGTNPIAGQAGGPHFVDMTEAYSRRGRELAREVAGRLGLSLPEGVYAAVTGPCFETPAEVRYLRVAGADLVGMSTVQETIEARRLGMAVVGISCVTNRASGCGEEAVSHEEVLEIGRKIEPTLARFLEALIPALEAIGE